MAESPPPGGGFLPPEPQGPEPDLGGARPDYAPPAHAAPQAPEPPQPPQPPAWTSGSQEPDNGPAVLGFCLSLSSGGLLLMSAGLSSLVSVGLAIPGMLQSRKGTRRVHEGLTTKNAGLASAGWVIGIVCLVLSVLATIFWVVIAVLIATDDEARREFEREFDEQYDRQSSATVVLVLARLAGLALS